MPDTHAEPATRRPRSAARKDLIIEAALDQFRHYGVRGASLEQIAKAAGVSRPALYHHFASKEELFRETARSVQDDVLAKVRHAASQAGSVHERLDRMMAIKCRDMHEAMWRSRHGDELFDQSNRLCADLVSQYRNSFASEIGGVIASGVEAKELDLKHLKLTPDTAGDLLFYSSEGLHERFTGNPVAPEIYLSRLKSLIQCFIASAAA